jgi:hypothetical protein
MSQHSDHNDNRQSVELPSPTGWPIVAAFGLTLLFVGLVTDLWVSVVGVLVGIFGAVHWCLDVFPHSKHVTVDWVPEAKRAVPVTKSDKKIEYLNVGGEAQHRASVPTQVHPYSAGVIGGVAGGIAMALVALVWGALVKHSIWYPVNLLAAVGVPSLASADETTLMQFSILGLVVALLTHATISIMAGLLYVVVLPMLPAKFEWLWGGIIAPLVWSTVIYFSLGLVSQTMAQQISWLPFLISQVAFGLVGGFMVYKTTKVETMGDWTMARRLGVEAQHPRDDQ